MHRREALATLAVLALSPTLAFASEASPQALELFRIIDELDVEHHWPAGVHVDWKTGTPDGRPESGEGKHTHCSAFVAAAAMKAGIYILRPPQHPQTLLANAQYEWLGAEGTGQGWRSLPDAAAAQAAANQGAFVVAAYRNHRDDKPGHIAIVRPSAKSRGQLAAEGPDVTQAGGTNYRIASLKQGFAGHPQAFADHDVVGTLA